MVTAEVKNLGGNSSLVQSSSFFGFSSPVSDVLITTSVLSSSRWPLIGLSFDAGVVGRDNGKVLVDFLAVAKMDSLISVSSFFAVFFPPVSASLCSLDGL
jgi:hypothetical protein